MKRRPGRNHFAHNLRENATAAERILWDRLSKKQLGATFIRQGRIGTRYATFVARSRNVAVEVDRGGTNNSPNAFSRITPDVRTKFDVLFFWDIDVLSRTDEVVDAIREALQ